MEKKDSIYPLICIAFCGKQGLQKCHIFAYSLSINLTSVVDTEILKGVKELGVRSGVEMNKSYIRVHKKNHTCIDYVTVSLFFFIPF